MDLVTLIFQAVTALATLGAAFAAYKSARETNRTAKETKRAAALQIVFEFKREYSSQEMSNSLRILSAFFDRHNERPMKVAEEYKKIKYSPENHTDEFLGLSFSWLDVEKARRNVKSYFLNAVKLYKANLIDAETTFSICNENGINVFFKVVVPMTLALNPTYDKPDFDLLARIMNKYADKSEEFSYTIDEPMPLIR